VNDMADLCLGIRHGLSDLARNQCSSVTLMLAWRSSREHESV
jgi:hypothetical protein